MHVFLSLEVCANWVEIVSSEFEGILKILSVYGEKSKFGSTNKFNM